MNPLTDLLSTTAELALSLIEKNGVLVPFCRAVTSDGEIVFYSPETHDDDLNFKKAESLQRDVVLSEITIRKFVGLAFCKNVLLNLRDPDEEVSAIKIELHQAETKALTHYFTYRIENGTAAILQQHTQDAAPVELWNAT
jgi:hypothetical protein